MLKYLLLLLCLGQVEIKVWSANIAPETAPLSTLRSGHPRLLALDDQLAAVKELIKTDSKAQALYQQLQADAAKIFQEPLSTYEIGGPEHTLLSVSREVEARVWLLAGLYRLSGDAKYAARARDEMLAAARFPDWYPQHFLDTAEMTAALGVGYDWLFDFLSPSERQTIRQAIVAKGLDPGIAGESDGGRLSRQHNNWVQVCNGGLTIGALAIADEEKMKAAKIIALSRTHIAKIMELFAPDGGFEEGPIYWNYATIYNVCYLAALESALGTDFGLSQAKGFDVTGNYRMQTIGPLGKSANFGDASEQISCAPQMFWLARKFNHPEYALHERTIVNLLSSNRDHFESGRFSILELLWDSSARNDLADMSLPAGAKFDRIHAAFLRSGWGDTNAIYVAFKGGSNRASHGHLDLGSFVLDAFGERWALDLEHDSYGLPGYFGAQRWSYYRERTEGHNTLTVDNQNEDLQAEAPLTAFASRTNQSFAIADLAAAYPHQLSGWRRGIMLLNANQVLVQDEVSPKKTVDLTWNFHTHGTIKISADGREALLSHGNSRLLARILSPASAKFNDSPVIIAAPQKPAPGIRNLMIQLPKTAMPTRIAVVFQSPDNPASPPSSTPLSDWNL
jgi:hypothetical protein